MKYILGLILFILSISCSSTKTYFLRYETDDYKSIVDSVKASGTFISPWDTTTFILDDSTRLITRYAYLRKPKNKQGSIQVIEENGKFIVQIIDVK